MDGEQGRAFIRANKGDAYITLLGQAADQAGAAADELIGCALFTRLPETTPEEALAASQLVVAIAHRAGEIPSPTVHIIQVLTMRCGDLLNELTKVREELAEAKAGRSKWVNS